MFCGFHFISAIPVQSSQTLNPVHSEAPAIKSRRRRPRASYTPQQVEVLETAFAKDRYPDVFERDALAEAVNISEVRVKVSSIRQSIVNVVI